MSHLVFEYPIPDQVRTAGQVLYGDLTGAAPIGFALRVNCLLALACGAASVIPDEEPAPPPPQPMLDAIDCKARLIAALKPLHGPRGKNLAIDWASFKNIARLALQFLLTLLTA